MARSIWFERPGIAAVREEVLPTARPGEIVVEAICSGISAGTERLVLNAHVPLEARELMALPTMRGSFELPIAYGYAVVGRTAQPGHAGDGTRILALHPHQDRFVARASALRPLPDGPPAERLVLAPNVETAVNVVWDSAISMGDDVVVAGLGVVGLLVTWLARKSGAIRVRGIDPDPERRALAEALGATATAESATASAIGNADVLIDASGSTDVLRAFASHAGREARVVVASWYGSTPCTLALGGTFHPHRVTIRSSQVAAIDPARRGRWDHARRWRLVCELLGEPILDRLIAPSVPLSAAPTVYAELAAGHRWHPPQRVFDLMV